MRLVQLRSVVVEHRWMSRLGLTQERRLVIVGTQVMRSTKCKAGVPCLRWLKIQFQAARSLLATCPTQSSIRLHRPMLSLHSWRCRHRDRQEWKMSDSMESIIFSGDVGHLTFEVSDYERPTASDVYDANWLKTTVS